MCSERHQRQPRIIFLLEPEVILTGYGKWNLSPGNLFCRTARAVKSAAEREVSIFLTRNFRNSQSEIPLILALSRNYDGIQKSELTSGPWFDVLSSFTFFCELRVCSV